jgi:hypothetical protein
VTTVGLSGAGSKEIRLISLRPLADVGQQVVVGAAKEDVLVFAADPNDKEAAE